MHLVNRRHFSVQIHDVFRAATHNINTQIHARQQEATAELCAKAQAKQPQN
jgi:hypothetical protein